MTLYLDHLRAQTRRQFLAHSGLCLGGIALSQMLGQSAGAATAGLAKPVSPLGTKPPAQFGRAKSVIYLSMSGGPPQMDLFTDKPRLREFNMKEAPQELIKGERFAFIKGTPKLLGSPHEFARHGKCGTSLSNLLPHTAQIADDITVVNSLHTDQFNHGPAELFVYTGNARNGAASFGSWVTYGLGTLNQDLPGFVVLGSGGSDPSGGKACWGNGFLPGVFQGTQCRTSGDPILYVADPAGVSRESRRRQLDALAKLNGREAQTFGDADTVTRINQYELAYRMQASVPDAFDISREPAEIQKQYGAEPGKASFANNCLLARRLVERGVRFIHLFDWGWDLHGTTQDNDLTTGLPNKCKDVDQASAALVMDLKQRGMLDDTLVIWGGEFGRTPLNEARNGSPWLGRDHHPHCFSMWFAGGGFKRGFSYGQTDDFGYRVAENPVGVRDLQATLLHVLGLNPFTLSYKYQGLNNRWIGPSEEGKIVTELLA